MSSVTAEAAEGPLSKERISRERSEHLFTWLGRRDPHIGHGCPLPARTFMAWAGRVGVKIEEACAPIPNAPSPTPHKEERQSLPILKYSNTTEREKNSHNP